MVKFNSVSARSDLETIDFIETFLRQHGLRLTRINGAGDDMAGLYAEIEPSGRSLLLSGHTDVVSTEGQDRTSDPFRLTVRDAKLFGRGTPI